MIIRKAELTRDLRAQMRGGEGTDAERLTRLGRFLRATSLDELPQLLHVLSGKMALVGPRPLPSKYLPRYSPEQARRHEVRPGITGWAQVNGRDELSVEDKARLDGEYAAHITLGMDIKCLWKTVATVVTRKGFREGIDPGETKKEP